MTDHTEPHDLPIDTSGRPQISYRNETDANSVLWTTDPTTYATMILPNGRVGVWYRKNSKSS